MALVGPKKKPQDFAKDGEKWFHVVVNDEAETAKGFDQEGKLLWTIPALARGQDDNWRINRGDTPPGIYKIGDVYNDYDRAGSNPPFSSTLRSYGWYSFDLIDLEAQESGYGRAGIMMHGGGSACGWPGAWDPKQHLYPTHGCVRMRNLELKEKVFPLVKEGTVFVSVYQDY